MPFADPPSRPWPLVDRWLDEARNHPAIRYPQAACLATVADDGGADARILLAERSHQPMGFAVLTDTGSPKAHQLRAQPIAALTFYWPALERQLRVRGPMHLGPATLADRLFEERPRQSRATAWVSRQSQPFDEDAPLVSRIADHDEEFATAPTIPRPERWQVFVLVPQEIELWQAAARRLHHRLRYRHQDETGWHQERLEP